MNNTEPIEKEANLRTLNAVLQTELSVTQYHLATCQRKAEENERAFEKAKQAHEENINALQSDIVCLKEEVIELQAIIAAKDAISAGTAKTPTTQDAVAKIASLRRMLDDKKFALEQYNAAIATKDAALQELAQQIEVLRADNARLRKMRSGISRILDAVPLATADAGEVSNSPVIVPGPQPSPLALQQPLSATGKENLPDAIAGKNSKATQAATPPRFKTAMAK